MTKSSKKRNEATKNTSKRSNGKSSTTSCCDHHNQKKFKQSNEEESSYVATSQDAQRKVNDLKHSDPVLRLELNPSDEHIPQISFDTRHTLSSSSSAGRTDSSTTTTGTASLLEKLLYPLSPKSFMKNCFRQKAVHVKVGTSPSSSKNNNTDNSINSRVSYLNSKYMFDLNPKQIFEETSSDSVFLWIPSSSPQSSSSSHETHTNKNEHNKEKRSSTNHQPKPLQSIEIQDPEMAYILHTSSNYASYCRAPPELEQPLVYHLLKDTGIGCGHYETLQEENVSSSSTTSSSMGRGEVETFIGTKNHVTDWHVDFQENFTIQLSGCKKWILKQGTMKHPIRGITPHYKNTHDVIENQLKASRLYNSKFTYNGKQNSLDNAHGNEVEIIMKECDVLYFPAGMWHKVETLEYGVSINISLMGCNYASVVCGAIEHLLLKKDEWREVVCNNRNIKSSGSGSSSSRNEDNYVASNNTDMEEDGKIVVQKLEKLLGDLPDIIREFKSNGGAEFILPPVLRRAPNYVLASDDLDGEYDNDDDGIENDNADDEVMKDEHESHDDEELVEDGDGGNGSYEVHKNDEYANVDDEEEGTQLIDLKTFQCPAGCDYKKPSPSYKLKKNPLAILMKMSDVTSFDDGTNNTNQDENKYILNVSYAGNEQHEASVRAVFYDDTGALDALCQLEKRGAQDEQAYEDVLSPGCPFDALFYYGYFIWMQ